MTRTEQTDLTIALGAQVAASIQAIAERQAFVLILSAEVGTAITTNLVHSECVRVLRTMADEVERRGHMEAQH